MLSRKIRHLLHTNSHTFIEKNIISPKARLHLGFWLWHRLWQLFCWLWCWLGFDWGKAQSLRWCHRLLGERLHQTCQKLDFLLGKSFGNIIVKSVFGPGFLVINSKNLGYHTMTEFMPLHLENTKPRSNWVTSAALFGGKPPLAFTFVAPTHDRGGSGITTWSNDVYIHGIELLNATFLNDGKTYFLRMYVIYFYKSNLNVNIYMLVMLQRNRNIMWM